MFVKSKTPKPQTPPKCMLSEDALTEAPSHTVPSPALLTTGKEGTRRETHPARQPSGDRVEPASLRMEGCPFSVRGMRCGGKMSEKPRRVEGAGDTGPGDAPLPIISYVFQGEFPELLESWFPCLENAGVTPTPCEG